MTPALATTRHRIYVLTTRTSREQDVVRELRRIGVKSYAPAELDYRPSGPVAVMLFPCYVFCWIYDEWRKVLSTKGVTGMISFGDTPAKVRPQVIKDLRRCEGPTGYIRTTLFDKLQKVRFVEGGHVATVVSYESVVAKRVRLLLTILGKPIEMVVPEQALVAA